MSLEALIRLHVGLARKGPGSEASTLRALAACRPHMPTRPAVADLGCGSGASALVLARALAVPIQALDLAPVFLEELAERAAAQGLGDRIRPLAADIAAPPLAPGSLDLLWCEGAAYLLGFARALEAWRPLLRPGGLLALTDAVWRVEDPPEEPRGRWDRWYPSMGTLAGGAALARDLGFEVLTTFVLPEADWWAYYDPLWERCVAAREGADAGTRDVIAETALERDLLRRFPGVYGYGFFVLKAP